MDGHLFTFTQVMLVSSKLMSHLLDAESTPEEASGFSVLRED
jgi:hypothetical protein